MVIDLLRTLCGLAYLLVYFICFTALLCLPIVLLYVGMRAISFGCLAILDEETRWRQGFAGLLLATVAFSTAYVLASWFVLPLLSRSGMNS